MAADSFAEVVVYRPNGKRGSGLRRRCSAVGLGPRQRFSPVEGNLCVKGIHVSEHQKDCGDKGFTLFLLGYSRGRGPSCRQGISILSPKLIGILKQWSELVVLNNRNGILSAIWCLVIMLSRFPHEPVLRSRREEQTDLRKNWLQEEGCWNNSHYERDLVWKCKSPHKILCFSWLVQIKRFLIHELLEEPVT